MSETQASIDPGQVEQFMGKMLGDMGAAVSGALVILGDRLGLYRALAEGGPQTADQLAQRTGAHARYVLEWLNAQAAAEYVDYDPVDGGRYSLNPVQQMVFADEGQPTFMAGAFELLAAMYHDEPKVAEAFRTGRGVGWHEHHPCLFRGTERFFRVGYNAHLLSEWLPALDGVVEKLERGARVADVGCGHGASTVIMAEAFPNSQFTGFDYHAPSIERATAAANEAGLSNARFQTAAAKDFPGSGYDLVCIFDALHDMGDPVGAARHIRETMASDGAWMLVEPFAGDRVEDNLNPVGRIFYSASTMICTPASLSQEVGAGLGAQAGEAQLRRVCEEAGFTRFRRAAETPFNLIFDVRP